MENVFITGADRGVGFALCEEFAAHGFRVLAGQYMPEWGALAELAEKYPGQVECILLDVSDTASVQEAVRTASELVDRIDILVNCAGIIRDDSRKGFYDTLNTNTVGTLRTVELFLPLMKAAGGGCVSFLRSGEYFHASQDRGWRHLLLRFQSDAEYDGAPDVQ